MSAYLEAIWRAFANEPRPEHFTNYTHCCECAEHDETLRGQTREAIGLAELGNAGWDPVCFITPEGFMYYFPALAKLALGEGTSYYLDQFIFHLNSERVEYFNSEQRKVVREFLQYLRSKFVEELKYSYTKFDLESLLESLATK